jgi:hypothetical protein
MSSRIRVLLLARPTHGVDRASGKRRSAVAPPLRPLAGAACRSSSKHSCFQGELPKECSQRPTAQDRVEREGQSKSPNNRPCPCIGTSKERHVINKESKEETPPWACCRGHNSSTCSFGPRAVHALNTSGITHHCEWAGESQGLGIPLPRR